MRREVSAASAVCVVCDVAGCGVVVGGAEDVTGTRARFLRWDFTVSVRRSCAMR